MAKKTVVMIGDGYIAKSFIRNNKHFYNFSVSSRKTFENNLLQRSSFKKDLNSLGAHALIFSLSSSSFRNTSLKDVQTFIEKFKIFLDIFKHSNINKLIFLSSSSVYGLEHNENKFTEASKLYDDTNYRIEKIKAEEAIKKTLAYSTGKRFFILRLSNPYGFYDEVPHNGIINKCFLNLKLNKQTTINNSGKSVRDYIFIDDLTYYIKQTIELEIKSNIFNIGSGVGTSLNKIKSLLENKSKNFLFKIDKHNSDYENFSILNMHKTIKLLNYSPKFTIENGIDKFFNEIFE